MIKMKSRSIYKIPNGKLLKIYLNYDEKNSSIDKISITGDFFIYPEEAIDILENELIGLKLDKEILFRKIDSIIKKRNIDFIGIDVEGLTKGILMCKK
jgi:lipoate-protein ligase A